MAAAQRTLTLFHTQVVGEGYHPKAGQPHAEVFALRGAGETRRSFAHTPASH